MSNFTVIAKSVCAERGIKGKEFEKSKELIKDFLIALTKRESEDEPPKKSTKTKDTKAVVDTPTIVKSFEDSGKTLFIACFPDMESLEAFQEEMESRKTKVASVPAKQHVDVFGIYLNLATKKSQKEALDYFEDQGYPCLEDKDEMTTEEEKPKKSAKGKSKKAVEEKPKKKGKKSAVVEDEEEEEKPKKSTKGKKVVEDDEEEEKPKKKGKKIQSDEEKPKKSVKSKKVVEECDDDDDEEEVLSDDDDMDVDEVIESEEEEEPKPKKNGKKN